MDLCLTSAIVFSPTLLATQHAAATSITAFLLTVNDCIRNEFLISLKNLSESPSSALFGGLKGYIHSFTLDSDGDETAVTTATDPDDIICADGIDVGTVSSRANDALVRIKTLRRLPDWKAQTAKLHKEVSARFTREIFATHAHQRRVENEIVESLSGLTEDSHSVYANAIRRTRSA